MNLQFEIQRSVDIAQNTLYLTTPASYVARDHLTLQVEVPVYPDGLARTTACVCKKRL